MNVPLMFMSFALFTSLLAMSLLSALVKALIALGLSFNVLRHMKAILLKLNIALLPRWQTLVLIGQLY
jgi:hypothetical protein